MTQQPYNKLLWIIGGAIIVGFLGYYIWSMPDERDASQKISDAIEELPNGAEKAARQLESRTPGEKIQDAAKDAGNDLKKATNQQ
jgi:hypothetical protein